MGQSLGEPALTQLQAVLEQKAKTASAAIFAQSDLHAASGRNWHHASYLRADYDKMIALSAEHPEGFPVSGIMDSDRLTGAQTAKRVLTLVLPYGIVAPERFSMSESERPRQQPRGRMYMIVQRDSGFPTTRTATAAKLIDIGRRVLQSVNTWNAQRFTLHEAAVQLGHQRGVTAGTPATTPS